MTKPDLHPDLSIHDFDDCSEHIQTFIARAVENRELPELPSGKDKHDLMHDFIKTTLGKQQLFGVLTKADAFTIPTDEPTLLEHKLVEQLMHTACSQMSCLLQLFEMNPKGTIKDGGPSVHVGNKMDKLDEVQFSLVEDLVLKCTLGGYLLRLHNILTKDSEKQVIMNDIMEDAEVDEKFVDKADSIMRGNILDKLRDVGLPEFFDTPQKLKTALQNHVTGKQDITDALNERIPEGTHKVDAQIQIGKIMEVILPLIELANHIENE